MIEVTHDVYLVNELKVKILIGINVLTFYKIILDFDSKKLLINIYFFKSNIGVCYKDTRITRKIKAVKYIIILSYSIGEVSVRYIFLLKNREYLFELALINIFVHVVDTLSFV